MSEESHENLIRNSLLTILIPTYKRVSYVSDLLQSLLNNVQIINRYDIDLVISENLPSQETELKDLIEKYKRYFEITLTNPNKHLISAEENLFFGWQSAKGKYIWILGDDDPINFEVMTDLLERCTSGTHDIYKYNANLLFSDGSLSSKMVTKANVKEIEMDFPYFLQNVGFWHTGAGFSTWIFKNNLINPTKGLTWVNSFRSPVYSHVTYFLLECHAKLVCFVNKPLVNYRVNEYVTDTSGRNHWDIYTEEAFMPRYFPWTLGFVQQLLRLESLNVIDRSYWGKVFGDHVNTPRFLEFNSMVSMAFQQLRLEFEVGSYSLTNQEWVQLIDYLEGVHPEISIIWDLFRLNIESKSLNLKKRKYSLRRLYLTWMTFLQFDEFFYFKSKNTSEYYEILGKKIFARNSKDLQNSLNIEKTQQNSHTDTALPKLNFLKKNAGRLAYKIRKKLTWGLFRVYKNAPNFIIFILISALFLLKKIRAIAQS